MKMVLKINLIFKNFLCFINSNKYIHSKRVALFTLEYYNYVELMRFKVPVEEVRKQKQKIDVLSIHISPKEIKKIRNKINKSLQKS